MATFTMHPQTLSCRTQPSTAFARPVRPSRVAMSGWQQRQSGYGGSSRGHQSGKGSASSSRQWGAQGVGKGSGGWGWWEAQGGSSDWLRDPNDDGFSDWWRDPNDEVQEAAEAAENIADDYYNTFIIYTYDY